MDEKKYQKKLIANDQDGLAMISALLNSSKVKVSDMKYLPSSKIFLLSAKRSKIEDEKNTKEVNSICRVDYVSKVKSKNIDQKNQDLTLELLAIDYLKNKENFEINLIFKDNAHIALSTELIDITLEDQIENYKNENIR
tara:strand:+ start:2049 stop:2465 length:417 start_codon:yes stop_codon:yes gene_type:complete